MLQNRPLVALLSFWILILNIFAIPSSAAQFDNDPIQKVTLKEKISIYYFSGEKLANPVTKGGEKNSKSFSWNAYSIKRNFDHHNFSLFLLAPRHSAPTSKQDIHLLNCQWRI